MQAIMPIDEVSQEDFVKVSIQKFYRISGDSNQIKGVIPDVPLPVLFDSLVPREKSYKTALAYDGIKPKASFRKFNLFNHEKVIELSKERVVKDPRFIELKKLNDEINTIYNDPKPPVRLTFEDVFQEIHQIDNLWKQVKKITERPSDAIISNTSYDKEILATDIFQQEINSFKIKDVRANHYLEEAMSLINDYNRLKRN